MFEEKYKVNRRLHHEAFDVIQYIREKELGMKGFTREKIQQRFTEDCIAWGDGAQRRAKTGHRQDHLGSEIERLSRNLYEKLLWDGGDRQNLRRLQEREVEKQEMQRVEDYELHKHRWGGHLFKTQQEHQAWGNVISRQHTIPSRYLGEMKDTRSDKQRSDDFQQLQERKKLLGMYD